MFSNKLQKFQTQKQNNCSRRSVEHFDVLDFSEFGETSHEVVEVVVVVILLRESAHVKYATLRLR